MTCRLLVLALLLLAAPAWAVQRAKPDAQTSGAWDTPSTNCHLNVDEDTVSDTDTCQEDDGSTVYLSLSDVTDPGVSTGHNFYVWAYRSSNKSHTFQVRLLQDSDCNGTGATQIWDSGSITTLGGAPSADVGTTLSAEQADTITNYNDLCVEMTATGSNPTDVFVAMTHLEVPDAPTPSPAPGGRRVMVIGHQAIETPKPAMQ